eukprot:gene583-6672_t
MRRSALPLLFASSVSGLTEQYVRSNALELFRDFQAVWGKEYAEGEEASRLEVFTRNT